ncbi:hypothetical protein JHK82_053235 [Glycine max]|nr:hypothetical protein JHK84_053102 [Glycine max]KAG5085838.1 hypothetical protein JHK82_053235 [Glycine max]
MAIGDVGSPNQQTPSHRRLPSLQCALVRQQLSKCVLAIGKRDTSSLEFEAITLLLAHIKLLLHHRVIPFVTSPKSSRATVVPLKASSRSVTCTEPPLTAPPAESSTTMRVFTFLKDNDSIKKGHTSEYMDLGVTYASLTVCLSKFKMSPNDTPPPKPATTKYQKTQSYSDSPNTKPCYYNNYSLTQPIIFA